MNRQARPSVTPITFPNQDGLRLFGMLHQPAVPREGAETVLILSPGVKMRVAPHRLYNKLAERLVAMGYPVLRFDFHGLGDSEGTAPEALLADFYGATQRGRYVGDTIAAMDWMQRTYGTGRFIAAGLCGGALTGLLTAAKDPRIVALCSISVPVILDGADRDAARYMTAAQLTATRTGYLRKLRAAEWRSWVRLLTFRSDFQMIARALFKPIQARIRRSKSTPANARNGRSARQHQPAVRARLSQHGGHFATCSARLRRVRSAVLGVRGEVRAAPRPLSRGTRRVVSRTRDPAGQSHLLVLRVAGGPVRTVLRLARGTGGTNGAAHRHPRAGAARA